LFDNDWRIESARFAGELKDGKSELHRQISEI